MPLHGVARCKLVNKDNLLCFADHLASRSSLACNTEPVPRCCGLNNLELGLPQTNTSKSVVQVLEGERGHRGRHLQVRIAKRPFSRTQ